MLTLNSFEMETLLNVNDSATDSTGFSNSFFTTTELNALENSFKWTHEEIARLIQIIVRPILLVVGTTGNCLTIYIMRKTSLKHLSTCFYMVVLAIADTSK